MNNFIKDLDTGEIQNTDAYDSNTQLQLKPNQWEKYWELLYQTHYTLCEAAQNNDVDALKEILAPTYMLPIDVNMKLEEQWCALHYACCEGHQLITLILLEHGAKPDVTNVHMRTPLHIATIKGFDSICEMLINYKCDINARDFEQNTPLHYACQLGLYNLVKLLLKFGAEHAARNNFNLTPYDMSYDQSVQALFENLIDSYSKRSFGGSTCSSRQDHVMRLLKQNKQPLLKIPTRVNRIEIKQVGPSDFQVLNQLGKGSFGQVYLVKQRSNSQYYAMKILSKLKVKSANMTRYIQTERNVLSYISSPFIVKLHFAFQTSNKLYLIMDYCPGGDLESLMNRRGLLPEKIARNYAAEIILALETLHKGCIVYRDLKPSNVVIDKDGHACLTDFGLAKELTNQKATSFCGSVAYLAPEMLDKKGHGFPIDWYLLGVMLFELTTGLPPFYNKDRQIMFRNIRFGKLQRPEQHISDELWNFINKLMVKNPSQRLGSKNDAADLKCHEWFHGIDFEIAQQRKLNVPKLPVAAIDDETDLKITFSDFATANTNDLDYIENWSFTK